MKVSQRLGQRLGQRLDTVGEAARSVSEQARERVRRGRSEQSEPPRPDDPGHRPRAAFAGVLDGRHLWLAIDATPGSLALREGATDRTVPLVSDLSEDDPRYRSVRADLAALPGEGEARYDVVVTAPGGKVHRVWTPPLAPPGVMRTPTVGTVRWEVARTTDGTLQVARTAAQAGVELREVEAAPDGAVTLHLRPGPQGADLAETPLRVVDEDSGDLLLERALTPDRDGFSVRVDPADIPDGVGLSAGVLVGELPVRRRADGLARPDAAVLLPQHQTEDGESIVVYRWRADGTLRVRRREAGQA